MADPTTYYGDISPRTAGRAIGRLLKRGQHILLIERVSQISPMDKNKGKVAIFRRYNVSSLATSPLSEGVTPEGRKIDKTDYPMTLEQYGDVHIITDVIQDTHEDPVLNEAVDINSQQCMETVETVRFYNARAGTTVYYANGTSRTDVNTFTTRGQLRKVVRYLKGQKANYFTQILGAGIKFNTEPVGPTFFGFGHTDLEADIRNLDGFVPIEKYSDITKPLPGEIGKCENIRFCLSALWVAWADGGGAAGEMISTTGTSADVYPLIIFAKDAFGVVPLKGDQAVDIKVINPEKPSKSDPLGQRGYVGWKKWDASGIINDSWMARIEVAATDNPT